MGKLVLYSPRPMVPQDCSHMKRNVVPNQSMTLKEVIKRFVRKEALPAAKQGIYVEGDYDLEKLANQDIVERLEVLEAVKEKVKRKKKVIDDFRKFEEDQKRASAAPDPNPPPKDPPPTPPKG